MTKHSLLGASSAERWMNCEGSVALIKALKIDLDSSNPEYRIDGTKAHGLLQQCLTDGVDAWELADEPEMGTAVQVFIGIARPLQAVASVVYIEEHMAHPDFHPDFYGTVDFAAVGAVEEPDTLVVLDFKYGEGIMVEVEWNPQIMYYAYGILRNHPEVRRVRMAIVQPRMPWHHAGVVRWFELDAQTVIQWAEGTLRPAMVRTETEHGLQPGDWCRFCPAKLVCPALTALFGAAATADARELIEWDDAAVGRNYPLLEAVEHYIRALKGDAFRRLNLGATIAEIKLVHKKANRVWNGGAAAKLRAAFGDDAFTKPELKSPREIEALGATAKALVPELAYTPESSLTVALADDNRVGVKVQTAAQRFPGETP